MPHVSQRKLNKETLREIDNQLINFFKDGESKNFILSELLTDTERLMLAKRLAIILLLQKGVSGYRIIKSLKVSPSTVARFSNQLESKEFKKIKNKIQNTLTDNLVDYLIDILSIPFDRPYKGVDFRKKR